jgi:CTD kinase subunit alpha
LRKENERKDKEARRQAQKEASLKAEKDKKRGPEGEVVEREAKRVQVDPLAGADVAISKSIDMAN